MYGIMISQWDVKDKMTILDATYSYVGNNLCTQYTILLSCVNSLYYSNLTYKVTI